MKRLKIVLQSKIFIIISLIFIICYIFIFTQLIQYKSNIPESTTTLTGKITYYQIDGNKLSLNIKVKEEVKATYYLKSEEEKDSISKSIHLNATVKVNGTLKEPSNNTIPNTFNYKKYLYNKHIYWLMDIKDFKIIDNNHNLFYSLKNKLIIKVNKYSKVAPYMHAFILGDKNYIDSGTFTNYKNNGVTHLFAVSGMHLSLLLGILTNIFKKLKIKEKISNIVIILFLLIYMFLIGFTASVVRASLLYIFMLLNKKLDLKLKGLTILYLLFLFLIILNPFYIYDLGFNYSFLTSFGLILLSSKITGNYLKKSFLISLIAFLFSLPLTILNFYEFNLLTVLNNILIVPLVSIILFPLSLLTFIIPFLEGVLYFGFQVLEVINEICNNFSLNIVIPKINIIFILLYYSIIYLIYKTNFKNVFYIIILIISYKISPFLDGNNYIYYLDVGQGDSTLIITEHQKDIILIDTGGKIKYDTPDWQKKNHEFNLTDNLVQFMHSLGISKLDLLIGTHGDVDHIGYAKDLINKIKVKKLMLNNNELNWKEKELTKEIKHQIENIYTTKSISIKNLNEFIIKDENDSSLVLYFKLQNKSFLIMGDAPISVEENIIKNYKLKNIDVLKVGHHGSKTSSSEEFIAKISPKYSIISVGKNNRYGHPNKEVLDNLNNSKIYRTDLDGSIKFKINKNKLDIETCPP